MRVKKSKCLKNQKKSIIIKNALLLIFLNENNILKGLDDS